MGQDGSPGDNFLLPNPLLSPNPLTQDFPSSPPLLKDRASDGDTLLPFLQLLGSLALLLDDVLRDTTLQALL